jgi:hypothetical protein
VNVKNRHSASHDEQRSGTMKSDTRAIPAADPNNRLEYMKAIAQTANVEALGALLGLLGAWFVAWFSV